MGNVLKEIIDHQLQVVALRKELCTIEDLQGQEQYQHKTLSLIEKIGLEQKPHLITEFKRRSPSKADINIHANLHHVLSGYHKNGASAFSILTNEKYFGGSDQDVREARAHYQLPILRKEFIIDEYQLYEARAMGADLILLIAEALSKAEVKHLSKKAHELGLEVLLEMHSEDEIEKITQDVDFVGVNNRNLTTFTTSIETSTKLISKLPHDVIKVSESGLKNAADVVALYEMGYSAFLIGEHLMKSADVGQVCGDMVNEINTLLHG